MVWIPKISPYCIKFRVYILVTGVAHLTVPYNRWGIALYMAKKAIVRKGWFCIMMAHSSTLTMAFPAV
jgi:hypothetical protein